MTEQKLADWLEWKKKCALCLCAPDVQDPLRRYVWEQGVRLAKRFGVSIEVLVGSGLNSGKDENIPGEFDRANKGGATLWAYLEHRALAGTHASGKSYKDWIFSYAAGRSDDQRALSSILQGIKLQLKMVLRGVFAQEIALNVEQRKHRIDERVCADASGDAPNAWIESLAHKAEELLQPNYFMRVGPEERADFDQIADTVAAEWWGVAEKRDKIVLCAKFRGISLADPQVVKAAGVEKTQLYKCLNDLDAWLQEKVKRVKEDDPGTQYLRGAILSNLLERVELWEKTENSIFAGFRCCE